MNYINCKDVNLPSDMRKAVEFWARNTVGHIETLLNLKGTTSAVMQPYFSAELETLLRSFKKISSLYGEEETRRLACGLGRNVRLRAQQTANWGSFVEAWQDNGK